MNSTELEQKSTAWLKVRQGKITASGVCDLMTSGRGKDELLGSTAMKYLMERFASGLVDYEPDITSAAMEWGNIHEADARDLYEQYIRDITGNDHIEVIELGFVPVDGFEDIAGSSPDGVVYDYIGDEREPMGCIEIKCPFNSVMHTDTLLNKKIPDYYQKKYYAQCQMNMLTTGTTWCDFISYDPRMTNPKHRLVVLRIDRDDNFIEDLLMRLGKAKEIFEQWRKEL